MDNESPNPAFDENMTMLQRFEVAYAEIYKRAEKLREYQKTYQATLIEVDKAIAQEVIGVKIGEHVYANAPPYGEAEVYQLDKVYLTRKEDGSYYVKCLGTCLNTNDYHRMHDVGLLRKKDTEKTKVPVV